jgi:transposase
MADWMGKVVFLLTPLAEAIGRHIRAGEVFHADDTTVPVLSPGLGKTATGRLWVVVRNERPWGSSVPPAVFYRYSPDRRGIHADALLGECRGFLHADGYAGFDRLYRPTTPDGNGQLIEVACWSHFGRKLYDVHHATASPIALEALERMAALFAIEGCVNGCVPDRRRAARVEHAAPLLDQLKTFLDSSLTKISGKSDLAKAIRYALSRWKALVRYVGDGRLEMTNNAAERAMRIPVLGRKNYLFCGSDAGGQRAACLYTITATAKLNNLNPEAYMADVLGRIADHPINKIDALLPWFWTK